MQFKQKPNALVCYICGREFGTKSLQIHLKSCQSKFQQQQAQKQKKDRRNLPPQPQFLRELLNGNLQNLHAYNEQATQIHKYQVLPACKFCGRTFNEQSLKVHVKVCPKKTTSVEPVKKMYEQQIKKPRTLACCVCGREFGLASLKIHYPQCIQKFQNQQMKKSREQRKRTPVFSLAQIDLFENKTDWTNQQIQEFNNKALAIFRQKAMIHCQICKRSFMSQPYQKHLRNCKQNNKNYKEPVDQIYSIDNEVKKPKVLLCHICGRQFGLSSLIIHQKTCKQKFINAQKNKPKSQRKPLPTIPAEVLSKFSLEESQKWSVEKIQEYNKICNEIYRNQSMVQCSICKRKFIQTAYLKHKSYCEKNNKAQSQDQIKPQPPKIAQMPKNIIKQKKQIKVQNIIPQTAEQLEQTVVFQNLNPQLKIEDQKKNQLKQIHEKKQAPKVSEKKIKEESKKQAQKPKPEVTQSKTTEEVMKNESNLIQQSLDLQPCEKCGRKFLSERLQKHVSVCKGGKIIPNFKQKLANKPKQIQESNNYRSQRIQSNKLNQQQVAPQNHSKQLIPCSKCGRRFLQNRLAKHQQCCKGKQKEKNQNKTQTKMQRVKQIQKNSVELFQKKKSQNVNHQQTSKRSTPIDLHEDNQVLQQMQLKACSKCDRKFAIDRLQIHQNICKGKPKIKAEPPEKAKTLQVIKKTKQNFFKMVQDIKSKKIKQQQIDKQLQQQLKTLGNSQQNNQCNFRNKKQKEPKQVNTDSIKKMSNGFDSEKVSKWKKGNAAKRSPEKQFKKQGKGQSHLPKI